MITKCEEIEARTIEKVADLMCVAARTAPKGRGIDRLVTMTVTGDDKDRLAKEMHRIAEDSGAQFFARDAGCVDKAPIVVLFGQKVIQMGVAPCGYCGYANCAENISNHGLCAISLGDLGIAIGSAVNTASVHHVDNRIMFSIGRAALNLGFFEPEVKVAYGTPLSVTGKSPFHDRA